MTNPRKYVIDEISRSLMTHISDMTREDRQKLAEIILDDLRIEMSQEHGDLLVQEWSNLMEEYL